jgi:hypothetical protein
LDGHGFTARLHVHSADCWKELLEPIIRRYEKEKIRKYFRGDAAFAKPEIYEYLEEKGLLYAIRLPANDLLDAEIKHLLTRPVGRPSRKPVVWFHDSSTRQPVGKKNGVL